MLATAVAEARAEYYYVEDGAQTAVRNQNMFAALMEAVKVCSLGQITGTLYAVGGQYRRNM